jgi:hypothetical protein
MRHTHSSRTNSTAQDHVHNGDERTRRRGVTGARGQTPTDTDAHLSAGAYSVLLVQSFRGT